MKESCKITECRTNFAHETLIFMLCVCDASGIVLHGATSNQKTFCVIKCDDVYMCAYCICVSIRCVSERTPIMTVNIETSKAKSKRLSMSWICHQFFTEKNKVVRASFITIYRLRVSSSFVHSTWTTQSIELLFSMNRRIGALNCIHSNFLQSELVFFCYIMLTHTPLSA